MEPQGTPQPDSRPAPFLHSMLRLRDGPWAQALLPKLVEQESAAAVALTCSQMRDLCCSSRRSLKLGGLLERTAVEPGKLKSWVQDLPKHFPNCSAVSLELGSNMSFHGIPYVLPALARLPQLDGLSIALASNLEPLQASSMLYSMHTQLPKLQGLSMTVSTGHFWAIQNVFSELVDMTQLTRLCLSFQDTQNTNPLQDVGLHQLSGLTQLQHLAIRMHDWDDGERKQHYDLYEGIDMLPDAVPSVYGLTALTRLETDLSSGLTLFGISSCVSLQHLAVCVSDGLQPQEWGYLAPLTRLTQLRLLGAILEEPTPEAFAVLSGLTKLQVAAASTWSPGFLLALTNNRQLTEICGSWQHDHSSESSGPPGWDLPHVLTLSPGLCTPPFELFPNLRHFRADKFLLEHPNPDPATIHDVTLHSLCRHCTGLRELVLTAGDKGLVGSFYESQYSILPMGAPPAAYASGCTAALQALTSLQHLTCLKFCPSSKYELLALVQACSVLERHSLQEVHVVERSTGSFGQPQGHGRLNAAAWSQLGRLRRLRLLSVVITCQGTYRRLVREADVFLSALSGCGSVVLHLPGYTAPFDAALFELEAAGVPAPHVELVQLEQSATAARSIPAFPAVWGAATDSDNDDDDPLLGLADDD